MGISRGRAFIGSALAVALAATSVVVLYDRDLPGQGRSAAPNRTPFDQAMVALAAAPAIHYRTAGNGTGTVDVRVTNGGDSTGTVTVAGQRFGLMTVGGKTYIKPPTGYPTAGGGTTDRWVTGSSAPGAALTAGLLPPTQLANALLGVLNDRATFPRFDDPGTKVDGVRALRAQTSAGALYVTRAAPYRVLKFDPLARGGSRSIPRIPSLPPIPTLPPRPSRFAHQAPSAPTLPSAGLGALDFPELTDADVDRIFSELVRGVKQLEKSVNSDIHLNLTSQARVNCTAGGCLVTANVRSTVLSTSPDAKVAGGQVDAELTAVVTVDGGAAGTCVGLARMPVNGGGTISCNAASAGAVFNSTLARKRAIALAQSRAQNGRPVPYSVLVGGQAQVVATARVNVALNVARLLKAAEAAARLAAERNRTRTEPTPDPQPTGPQPTGPQPTDTAGPTRTTQQEPSEQPSPSAPPATTSRPPNEDCTKNPPGGAKTLLGGVGWVVNSTGAGGRAEAAKACLKAPLKRNKDSLVDPVGWAPAQARARAAGANPGEVARCHLIGAQFGAPNNDRSNLVPCWQQAANVAGVADPQGMTGFENPLAARVKANPKDSFEYQVAPHYKDGSSLIPTEITMQATQYDPAGAVVWVDWWQVPNERVVNRKVVNLGL